MDIVTKILTQIQNFLNAIRDKEFWLPNRQLVAATARSSSVAQSVTAVQIPINVDKRMWVTHIRVFPTPNTDTIQANIKIGSNYLFRDIMPTSLISSDRPLPGKFLLEPGNLSYVEVTTTSGWSSAPVSFEFLGYPA